MCLLGHAVGLCRSAVLARVGEYVRSILRVAPKIVRAVRQDDWSAANFASYQDYSTEVVKVNDRLVANSFTAFDSFPLWNAWFRIWISGSYIGVLRLRKILSDHQQHGDDERLEKEFESATYRDIFPLRALTMRLFSIRPAKQWKPIAPVTFQKKR